MQYPDFLRKSALLLWLCALPALAQNPVTSVSVDVNLNRHAISPGIYGLSFGSTSDFEAMNFTMNRSGGNATSGYNWQLNATNHANDWYFESIPDSPQTPGYDGDNFIRQTRNANVGAQPMLTIPMINYLANLGPGNTSLWSFSVRKYGAQTATDPYQPDAGSGVSSATGKNITGNNPLDANTPNSAAIQQAWIQHLISTWGTSSNGGLRYYIMDNEPSIWSSTHRDIHPAGETYDELYSDFVNYAGAVRAADPNALIVGPEEWGWWAQFLSGRDQAGGINASGSDYNTHNHTYYYPWLLQQLYAYQQSTNRQLLNVLSVHYYPAELNNSDDDSLSAQIIRNQSTRALWDPAFVDPSWLNQVGINGGIVKLIPNLKSWVNQYYPGLKTAITEYNWGNETHLNGATTQADVLGIFGREGLDLATRWTVPVNPSPTYLAMQIYRNYDGKLSIFGDTSVSASVANPDTLSSFAAVRSSDGALTVLVINKQQGATPVTINLSNFGTTGAAQAYQIASASQNSITQLGSVTVANNAIATTVPSQSITLFVIPSGNSISPPAPPTGLSATVGNGSVTLSWNISGGATSYNVKRGAVSGIYPVVNTTSGTSYTYSGLSNGTTSYYVVSAANSAGTSANSAEISASPTEQPTFTLSAAASPNPVGLGMTTNITATVTCTANTLSDGVVQILVRDVGNNPVASQLFNAQNFASNQTRTYQLAFTPSSAGIYTVIVAVSSIALGPIRYNASAASIYVSSAISFTSAVGSPALVVPGSTVPISLSVTSTSAAPLSNGNVELQIFDKSGAAVATTFWSGQNFTAGQNHQYQYNWTPSATLPVGNYTIDVGVFDGGWTTDYYWNTDATPAVVSSMLPITVKAGVFRNGSQFLLDSNGNGTYDAGTDRFINTFSGPGGSLPDDIGIAGDWTGNGQSKVGIYRASTGTWYLDANNSGILDAGDYTYSFGGLAGDQPFVGDWMGAGKSCIGIYRPGGSVWLLDLNCNGSFDNTPADAFFPFGGLSGDVPVVGNWTGPATRVGVVRKYAPGGVPQGNPFYWLLDGGAPNAGNLPANHPAGTNSFAFGGLAGDVFVAGDWYNTGISTAGVYRAGFWVLDAALPGALQPSHLPGVTFGYGGVASDVPITGKW